jgi:hypothetical protein
MLQRTLNSRTALFFPFIDLNQRSVAGTAEQRYNVIVDPPE